LVTFPRPRQDSLHPLIFKTTNEGTAFGNELFAVGALYHSTCEE